MKTTTKTFLGLVLLIICFFCIYFPLVFLVSDLEKSTSLFLALGGSIVIDLFLILIMKNENSKFLNKVVKTALVIGGLGFGLGFIGPIVLWPESNQGPLVGIFITGPLSILTGLMAGGVYWKINRNKL